MSETSERMTAAAYSGVTVLTWGLGDTVSTLFASARVGPGLEANPVMVWALHVGPLAVIGLKALAMVAVIAIIHVSDVHRTPGFHAWFLLVTFVGAVVVGVNIAVGASV